MTKSPVGSIVNGRYEILSVLGEGGMAIVYLARDKQDGKDVALKFLNSDQASLPRRKARFVQEFSILSRVQHPGIVRVYDQGETPEGVPFFSMEALSGRDLSNALALSYSGADGSAILSTDNVIDILKQIASVLAYLHSQKIVYCDLKPANIILCKRSESSLPESPAIKFVDFGIALVMDEAPDAETRRMVGTSYYMSPEQIRSDQLDGRSDIYSFGVVAFELLTGKVPFGSDARFDVTASHLLAKVPSASALNRSVPFVLDRMIRICMEKEQGNRYQSMDEVNARLSGVTANAPRASLKGRIRSLFSNLVPKSS